MQCDLKCEKKQKQGTSKPESRRCFATRLSMHSQLPACSEKSPLQKALTHEDQDAYVKKRIKNQMITQHPLLVSGGARRFVEKVCCILRNKQASRQTRTQGSVSKQARSKIAAQIRARSSSKSMSLASSFARLCFSFAFSGIGFFDG